ncbi:MULTISPECIES: hypothetical protein [unclassified Methylobacterium]|uniref:hypothetical protein n=1 Tax=unclassified Methylobacterium TaxID=2615210 RepID=UPI00226ACC0B|nr:MULTISPECIES: hypothetical protein [unclassified Methylobacterium]
MPSTIEPLERIPGRREFKDSIDDGLNLCCRHGSHEVFQTGAITDHDVAEDGAAILQREEV